MASGGALLCNYQPELAENFIDGEDVILYNCLEEALDKTMYYLDHEDERKQIALSAKEKVSARFRYSDAITAMLQDVKRGL
jgi:spore maturation protein CgeB